jgi:hypothetical protein
MQAPGTTESSQQGVPLLVIRTCLRCEKVSEHFWTGRMRSHTEQRSSACFCHRNYGQQGRSGAGLNGPRCPARPTTHDMVWLC